MTAKEAQCSLELSQIYRRYVSLVRGRALRMLGDQAQAEDIAHEVFITYFARYTAGKREENTAAYLYRMTTNRTLNLLRNNKRRRELLEKEKNEMAQATYMTAEELLGLREILGKVPKQEAEIASYYYLEGMDQEEISQLLNMQRRTVGRRLDKFCKRAGRMIGISRQVGEA